MSDKDDYQKLASQFVDMWQKNMAIMMNDSEFIRAFLHMMQASSSAVKGTSAYGNAFTDTGSARASSAPDPRDAAIAGIQSRLGAIEERLGILERSFTRFMSADIGEVSPGMANAAKRSGTGKGSRKGSGKKNI